MTFSDAVSAFEYLLTHSKENLNNGLDELHSLPPSVRDEVAVLISAYQHNAKHTSFSRVIADQINLLDYDKHLFNLAGTCISHFKLIQLIGQGGMGAVYLAERYDGQLEQQVAIKIIAPSITILASKEMAFKEAQYLARLKHNNIAQIYDVGTTDSGLIYIVMEYIEGLPLQHYCKSQSQEKKLALFIKVCHAVNYSHQNRIIHGDLKPDNILVNNLGEPKLVDFGVAHSLNEQSNTNCTTYLNGLSKDYASPEQLTGGPITTQSDVYSLGKVLASIASVKDLDIKSIVDCACAPVAQRYTNAIDLSKDIQRHLEIKPISLNKHRLYRARKFLQRNPLTSLLATSFFLSFIGFSSALWSQNVALEKEQILANSALEFMFDTFNQGNPQINKGKPVLAKDLLINQQKKTVEEFAGTPSVIYRLNKKIGDSLTALGEYENANFAYQQALNVNNGQLGDNFFLVSEIAENYIQLGHFSEADRLLQSPPSDREALVRYYSLKGRIHVGLEQYEQGDSLYEQALSLTKNLRIRSNILSDKAINLINLSRYQDSIDIRKESLAILTEHYPDDLSSIATAKHEIAVALHNTGKYAEAADIGLVGLEESMSIYGKEHPLIAEQMTHIASSFSELKQTQKAIDMLVEAKGILETFYDEPHVDVGFSHTYLGNAQLDLEDYSSAKENFNQALHIHEQLNHGDAHLKLGALNGLALVYRNTKKFEKARESFDDLLKLITDEYGSLHPRRGIVLVNAMPVHEALGNAQQAVKNGQEAIEIFKTQYGEDSQFIDIVQARIDNMQPNNLRE